MEKADGEENGRILGFWFNILYNIQILLNFAACNPLGRPTSHQQKAFDISPKFLFLAFLFYFV